MPHALNVGLDPALVGDPAFPHSAFPTVDAATVQAGIRAARAGLADLGLDLDTCFLDRGETADTTLRAALRRRHYEVVVVGAGVRLEPPLTPLFEVVVNAIREASPGSTVCFNTGPDTTVAAVRRWWPTRRPFDAA
jgi:hypothetical protein